MSQPGWYPDPYETGGLRWWDGYRWTEHHQPPAHAPAQQPAANPPQAPQASPQAPAQGWQPQQYGHGWASSPQQPAVPAVDVSVRGLRLYADEDVVAYGNSSLRWAQVEWLAYWTASQAPQTGATWVFQAGRHPFQGGPRVEALLDEEDVWNRLVDFSRRIAAPRLVGELVARVQAGESVDVGQGLTVHPGGVRGGRVSLSWSAIEGATIAEARVWIHQPGNSAPVLYIPQQNPNAVLIPALLAALKR